MVNEEEELLRDINRLYFEIRGTDSVGKILDLESEMVEKMNILNEEYGVQLMLSETNGYYIV